jgi:UDP-N-acetylglucosamine 1-carboxyvinyltransferase
MSKIFIQGGIPLTGKVEVSGAKNSVLKLMAASLLSQEKCVIKKAPLIRDVKVMGEVLEYLGAKVLMSNGRVEVIPIVRRKEAPYKLVSQMRASLQVLGPLLARVGEAWVARPGGCKIGRRKIDLHLKGLSLLGADISFQKGYIVARGKKLRGARVFLDYPSVGATENIMMASVFAKGKTVIENAAREPEIVDLANFLKKMGARIEGEGSSTIEIKGVEAPLKGVSHEVIPDRIEAGTFLIAGVVTRGEIFVKGANAQHLEMFLLKIEEMGAFVKLSKRGIKAGFKSDLRPIDIATLPYPGFPTDLQPQITSLLTLVKGTSVVTENVFDNRFLYVEELLRLGADIEVEGKHAIIKGVEKLSEAPVRATDLRGGAALVLACLAAEGKSEVEEVEHIDRGYEDFVKKFQALGASIQREES